MGNGGQEASERQEILGRIVSHCVGCCSPGTATSPSTPLSLSQSHSSTQLLEFLCNSATYQLGGGSKVENFFEFQGHMMWVQRQDSFREKFGTLSEANPKDAED